MHSIETRYFDNSPEDKFRNSLIILQSPSLVLGIDFGHTSKCKFRFRNRFGLSNKQSVALEIEFRFRNIFESSFQVHFPK